MKKFRLASLGLGMALALGAMTGLATSPAVAKEKPAKPEKPVPAKLSPAFQKVIGPVQQALQKKDWADVEAKLPAAAAAASTPDDKFYLGSVRFDVGRTKNDLAMQRLGIGDMVDSGSSLNKNLGPMLRQQAMWAWSDKNYPTALEKFTAAEAAGVKDGDTYIIWADALAKSGRTQEGLAKAKIAVSLPAADGTKAPENWYHVTRQQASKAKLIAEAGEWSRMLARAYPTKENLHDMLAYYINDSRPGDQARSDAFRLMRASKSVTQGSEYRELADLLLRVRYPGEAKAVIDEGLANNLLNAGSQQTKDLLALANSQLAGDKASLASSEKLGRANANGRVAGNVAEAYLGYGDYAKAIELFNVALGKGGVDADELKLRLGMAQLGSGQKEAAKQSFASVGGTRADLGKMWGLWADLAQ